MGSSDISVGTFTTHEYLIILYGVIPVKTGIQ